VISGIIENKARAPSDLLPTHRRDGSSLGGIKGEIDDLLDDLRSQGWRTTKGKRYWKCWCPCEKKHWKTVHVTPSDPRYMKNLRGQLKRTTCWKEGGR